MQPTLAHPSRRPRHLRRSRWERLLTIPLAAAGIALLVWGTPARGAPQQPLGLRPIRDLRARAARAKAAALRSNPVRARRAPTARPAAAPRHTAVQSANKPSANKPSANKPSANKLSPFRPRALLLKRGDAARKHVAPEVRARAGELALAGAHPVRAKPKHNWLSLIVFFLLALGCVGFAVVMITRRSPLMSALSLLVVFLCLAGLYVMLRAPFMAAIQLIVYAGAIVVLFVFVIMSMGLKDAYGHRNMTGDVAYFLAGFLLAGAAGIIWVYGSGVSALLVPLLLWAATLALYVLGEVAHPVTRFAGVTGAAFAAAHLLKLASLTRTYTGELILGGKPATTVAAAAAAAPGFGNPQTVGRSVFGDNVFTFEALSLLLLAAIVAAVVIVRSRKEAA